MYPGNPAFPQFAGAVAACMLVTFLICGIPFGVIIGELMGKGDIRKSGSGNIGTTNALRVGGKLVGALTLLCDVLKGLFCVMGSSWVLGGLAAVPAASLLPGQGADWALSLLSLAGLSGHMFSPYLHFKGGKGIAVGFGVCMGWIWPVGLSLWIPFLLGVVLTRYVSVGSIAAAVSLPFWVQLYYPSASLEMKLVFALMALLVVWAHRSNIGKLARGSESKLSFSSKGSASGEGDAS